MSDITPAKTVEPTPVQLTRMEGILTLIMYKVDALVPKVDRHEQEITDLHMSVQRLADEAKAHAATVVVTAQALKDAKEAEDAKARAEALHSDRAWSPWARAAVLVSVTVVVANFAAEWLHI